MFIDLLSIKVEMKFRVVRLVAFDLDGTLILDESSWIRLHREFGTWSRAKIYAEMFRRGEISYSEWARFDTMLWKNIPVSVVDKIVNEVEFRRGAKKLFSKLKKCGAKTLILSAGIDRFLNRAMRELNADYGVSNVLVARNGVLTGDVIPLVSPKNKGEILRMYMRRLGLSKRMVASVGDSKSDLSMFKSSGLAIALNPLDDVDRFCHVRVDAEDIIVVFDVIRLYDELI